MRAQLHYFGAHVPLFCALRSYLTRGTSWVLDPMNRTTLCPTACCLFASQVSRRGKMPVVFFGGGGGISRDLFGGRPTAVGGQLTFYSD